MQVFDSVTVLVSKNNEKRTMFTADERKDMIESIFKDNDRINVKIYDGLLVDYIKNNHVRVVIRGLRAVSDFEYEFQMAMTNRKLYPEYEVMFFITDMKYIYLSSSIVKELAAFRSELSCMVPEVVEQRLKEKF